MYGSPLAPITYFFTIQFRQMHLLQVKLSGHLDILLSTDLNECTLFTGLSSTMEGPHVWFMSMSWRRKSSPTSLRCHLPSIPSYPWYPDATHGRLAPTLLIHVDYMDCCRLDISDWKEKKDGSVAVNCILLVYFYSYSQFKKRFRGWQLF